MTTLWLILTIYVIVLVALVIISSNIRNHKKRFEVIFTYDMDHVFYEMAKTILDAKDHLYDYQNTLDVLYHDKKQIFTNPVKSYQEQYPKIAENIEYLEKLLQREIFSDKFRKRLHDNYQTLQRITRIGDVIHTILILLTLGIGKFWA